MKKNFVLSFIGGCLAFCVIACDDSTSANNSNIVNSSANELSNSSSVINSSFESSSSFAMIFSSNAEAIISSSSSGEIIEESSSSEVLVNSSSSIDSLDILIEIAKTIADSIIHDTIIDSRDGRSYKTVSFMGQTWFAENLKYKTDKSTCYDNDSLNCEKYGRLYRQYSYLCPKGWGLSSQGAWKKLRNNLESVFGEDAPVGTILKSRDEWNGLDLIGFNILPAGYYNGSRYYSLNIETKFWTSTEYQKYVYESSMDSWAYEFYSGKYMEADYYENSKYYSMRCIKTNYEE